MTLHWWMHWFWVTAQLAVALSSPIPDPTTSKAAILSMLNTTTLRAPVTTAADAETTTNRQMAKFQNYETMPTSLVTTEELDIVLEATQHPEKAANISSTVTSVPIAKKSVTTIGPKKESKANMILPSKGAKGKVEETRTSKPEILTVMPLEEAKPKSIGTANATSSGQASENDTSTSIPTVASISDSSTQADGTRLGRARGAFSSEFQRDQVSSENLLKNNESNLRQPLENGANALQIATITGSCLAMVILLSTVGSLGFIVYRRKYLNPPQTLTDKCSIPDSSGYIDDSTMRDNSEEMYSLDNDSFLNSLEAMTIQNYWTDVKHTKL